MADEREKTLNRYSGMMEEMKLRMDATEFAAAGLLKLHPVLVREFSYLQLRMICELIALACLLAHGDISATKSKNLRKAWSAEEIVKALERLHPDFYPHPCEQKQQKGYWEFTTIEGGFLTKQELVTLYNKCGDIVHRGTLKKLMSDPIVAAASSPDVADWLKKIRTLLNIHRIALVGGKSHLICQLRSGAEVAQVAFADQALPPPHLKIPGFP